MTDWPKQVEYDDLAIERPLLIVKWLAFVRRTAQLITQQCGIYTTCGVIMEGPHFRSLSRDVMKVSCPSKHFFSIHR